MEFGAQSFQRGGRARIDDGVMAAGFEKSGGDGVRAAGPVEIERGGRGHAIGIIREAGGGNKWHCGIAVVALLLVAPVCGFM